jgi:hypothetical protein
VPEKGSRSVREFAFTFLPARRSIFFMRLTGGLIRKVALLLWLSAIGLPPCAAAPISVEKLERWLAAVPGKSDAQIARGLSHVELTQRLDSVKLSHWLSALPGPKSQQALLALADMSAFLDLPPTEIPSTAAPDPATQRPTLSLCQDYIGKTIRQLPNLFATRVTTSYQENLWEHWTPESGLIRYQPLHLVGRFSAAVLYRDGGEEVHPDESKRISAPPGLQTSGEFGLLGVVLEDALESKLDWSHWEQSASGPVAVYRYSVPAEKSHYEVGSSWVRDTKGNRVVFQKFSAYEGEIVIDPSSGTILRLVLRAVAKPTDPLAKADLLVEYGPIVLAGKTYICPVRGVALSIGSEKQLFSRQGRPAPHLLQTSLNDVAFERYHLFHADAHIIGGFNP